MKKTYGTAVLIGMGLALASLGALAQQLPATAAPAAIPADQQPTKEQLAKLFEVMRLRQQLDGVMKAMPAMIQQNIQEQAKDLASKLPGGAALTPEKQAELDKIVSKFMQKALNIYTVDEMIGDMTVLYQRHLSRSDVDAFIAFYNSPAGEHLLDQQPAIMQEYMPLVMTRMRERSKAINDELLKELQECTESKEPATAKSATK
jgi:hypothetical protein